LCVQNLPGAYIISQSKKEKKGEHKDDCIEVVGKTFYKLVH